MTGLERMTVNLTPRGVRALAALEASTGDNKTDITNRALQLLAYLEGIDAKGGTVYVRPAEGAGLERLKLL